MEAGSYGKRNRSEIGDFDRTGDYKRRNAAGEREVIPGQNDTVYRILCPGKKIGSVIGKGGSIIKSLRTDTHAKIKVADSIPGVDERVIIIFSDRRRNVDGDEDADLIDGKKPHCAAQDALFRIFSRIMEDEGIHSDAEDEDENKAIVRLLIPETQTGSLIGKGGSVIEKMRSDTGAQIKVLPKSQLPACAMNTDELVQIAGPLKLVKRALYEVSTQLHENPPKERLQLTNSVYGQNPYLPSAGHMFPSGGVIPAGGASMVGIAPHYSALTGYGGDAPWSMAYSGLGRSRRRDGSGAEEFQFQMLCKNERIGGIIGKGGSTINQMRQETGAQIKLGDQVPDCDETVIFVSAKEYADDPTSPTLDAVLQLQVKASEKGSGDGKEAVITTRFLVPTNHIGCILGKGGNIITELRKVTRANIRIMPKEDLPKCASNDDELVQIIGEIDIARNALVQITSRLRANVFKDKESGILASSVVPSAFPYLSYAGLQSPGAMYSYSGFDLHGQTSGRYSAGSYGAYGSMNGASGMYGPSALSAGRVDSGGSGLVVSKNASGTSVDVRIPNKVVGSILGRGGSNINQIREISGAKVKLQDSKPGSSDRIVNISGRPDQVLSAQSLLESYVINGGQSYPMGRSY
eukprot:TRINITY_DN14833_c0_g1_i1.p1 TRINITY_DN14833_c0_g1~~TRINITY_DN14833_c0_g1_i1.p1  ORF type:complete len:634 (-),score=87.33 TRINITY_DN14833_c0_g1_i1:601-2502(-)